MFQFSLSRFFSLSLTTGLILSVSAPLAFAKTAVKKTRATNIPVIYVKPKARSQTPILIAQTDTSSMSASASNLGANSISASAVDLSADPQKKKFLMNVELGTSANLYKSESADREGSNDITLTPSLDLGSYGGLSVKAGISQDQGGARDVTTGNTLVAWSIGGPQISESLTTAIATSVLLPTSETSTKRDRLHAAGILTFKFILNSGRLGLYYAPAYRQNSHEFTINAEGNPLIQNSLTNGVGLSYQVSSKLSLTMDGLYRISRTYRNFQRQAYEFGADLNYEIMKDLSMSIGLGNNAEPRDLLSANGKEYDVRFFDLNQDKARASLSYTF